VKTEAQQRRHPADPIPRASELNRIILATDANFVLHDNPAVKYLARRFVHCRPGLCGRDNARTQDPPWPPGW
jgi:hypothetical protein